MFVSPRLRIPPDCALVSYAHYDQPQLLHAIHRGDEGAFTYIVQTTRETLVAYADRLVASRDEAEDIVQDVYVSLWLRRRESVIRGHILPYLRRAVRNRTIDISKRTRRRKVPLPDLPLPPLPEESDQRVLSRELEVAALTVLATLPLRCRQVFLLCALSGYTHAAAAKTLGLKASTINYYLVVARKGLFAGLRDRQFEIPTWVTKPDMIFTRRAEAPIIPRRCRPSRIHISATVNLDRHDPAYPFATTEVLVRKM